MSFLTRQTLTQLFREIWQSCFICYLPLRRIGLRALFFTLIIVPRIALACDMRYRF
jgi:hypothetical protein